MNFIRVKIDNLYFLSDPQLQVNRRITVWTAGFRITSVNIFIGHLLAVHREVECSEIVVAVHICRKPGSSKSRNDN